MMAQCACCNAPISRLTEAVCWRCREKLDRKVDAEQQDLHRKVNCERCAKLIPPEFAPLCGACRKSAASEELKLEPAEQPDLPAKICPHCGREHWHPHAYICGDPACIAEEVVAPLKRWDAESKEHCMARPRKTTSEPEEEADVQMV